MRFRWLCHCGLALVVAAMFGALLLAWNAASLVYGALVEFSNYSFSLSVDWLFIAMLVLALAYFSVLALFLLLASRVVARLYVLGRPQISS